MFLLVGLGNPGTEYENTRHNIGKTVVKSLSGYFKKEFIKEYLFEYFIAETDGNKLICCFPRVYVNESGKAVKAALENNPKARLVILYDDLDIPFGAIKIKKGGSSGGHNGINSIINVLGTHDFLRIKIGIGRPPARKEPADFVLEKFKITEQKEILFIVEDAKEAVLDVVKHGPDWAMNKFH